MWDYQIILWLIVIGFRMCGRSKEEPTLERFRGRNADKFIDFFSSYN